MTKCNNYHIEKSKLNSIYTGLFSVLIICILLLTGCGYGGGTSSIHDVSPALPTNLPIESIALVSPTESGSINVVTGYPQKLLVVGIDKNGTRKLLTLKDGLTFNLDNSNYAEINTSGIISGKIPGQTSLTINFNNKLSLNITVKIEETVLNTITAHVNNNLSSVKLPKNYIANLQAEGTFSDGKTRNISNYIGIWTSNNPKVAFESDTIFGTTLVTANVESSAIIKAKSRNQESNISVEVVGAPLTKISIMPNGTDIASNSHINMKAIGTYGYEGESFSLDITHNVLWSVEHTSLATIDNNTGILSTNESEGNIIINAKSENGVSTYASLTIKKLIIESIFITKQLNGLPVESITLQIKESTIIYPYARYVNGDVERLNITPSSNCTWIISNDANEKFAFSYHGNYAILSGVESGLSHITLYCKDNNLQFKTNVNVINPTIESFVIEPSDEVKIPLGGHKKLEAVIYYSNGESKNVSPTWSSESTEIASIDDRGIVSANSLGFTNINAKINIYGENLVAQPKNIEVTKAMLERIVIAGDTTIISGESKVYTATGYYSDNTHSEITNSVTWDCTSPLACYDKGIVKAEKGVRESMTAAIKAIDPDTGLTSDALNINVAPRAMVSLIFNDNPFYTTGCHNLSNQMVICYMQFLAVFNDKTMEDYTNFTENSIIISPEPTNKLIPGPTRKFLKLEYGNENVLPTQVRVKAIATNGFSVESTFTVLPAR
ncbi:MAG: hypothetical protein ACK5Z5_03880 [Neisseriaceae bacterium]